MSIRVGLGDIESIKMIGEVTNWSGNIVDVTVRADCQQGDETSSIEIVFQVDVDDFGWKNPPSSKPVELEWSR